MQITNAKYMNEALTHIQAEFDGVPMTVEQGSDLYNAVVALVGSQITPAPVVVAQQPIDLERELMVVSRFQARAALLQLGLLASVQAHIDSSTDEILKLAWTDAQEFRRTSPTIAALAVSLGWGDVDLDDMFRIAATITA